MLKIVEFGLLAVSLLTILGLILISPQGEPAAREPDVEVPGEAAGEAVHAHAPLGSAKKS